MKMITKRWALALTALIASGTTAFAAESAPVPVDAAYQSRHWSNVYTNAVPLTWEWDANVSYAVLNIIGMNGSFTTNFTEVTTNVLWRPFASDAPAEEDVYDLTLAFYTSGNDVVGAMTSRLAVVSGAFGQALVDPVEASQSWGKIKNNAVIPYEPAYADEATNAATAQLVIAKSGGTIQTNACTDAAGYFGWKIRNSAWGYGTFDLELTFPGTAAVALTAKLTRPLDGMVIGIR